MLNKVHKYKNGCFVKLIFFRGNSLPFRASELAFPLSLEGLGMSTFFRGITETIPSLFRGDNTPTAATACSCICAGGVSLRPCTARGSIETKKNIFANYKRYSTVVRATVAGDRRKVFINRANATS